MNIAYYHASKFGNGAMVAEEFRKIMAARGVTVSVHRVRDANPNDLPKADLYVFSSPGRMGKPKGNVRRFLRKVSLEPGTKYAILATQGAPKPDKTGQVPTQQEQDRWERVIPIMNEVLASKGLTKVTDGAVLLTGIKGPLEEGWQKKVQAFADQITSLPTNLVIENRNNRASNSPLHGLRRTPLRIMSVVSGHLGPPFARSRSQTVPRWVTGPIGLMRVPRRGGPMTNTSSQDEHENVARGRSRRLLLAGAAGALGLLAGEAIAPATPAQAGTDGDVVLGALNNASTTTTIDTVTSGQDTVAFAAADARTLSVQNDSLSQTVLAINNGGGAALFGFSGGEGVYGQSGITLGTKPGQTRNGVHGVTDSPADSGVWGEAVGGGVGVAGATSTVGIAGNPAVTGVNLGSGPGVKGESRGGGTAVHGVTASGGIGVLAQASGGGTALEVSGPALFSRSGLVTITGQGSATVSVLGGLSASALVLALLQTPVTDLWVRAAEPDQVTGEITIHLNRAPVRSVKVAWFVVN